MRLGRFGASPEVTDRLLGLCRELWALPAMERAEALRSLSANTRSAINALRYEWRLWARPLQLAPAPPWRWWVLPGGRGAGKTRTAAELVSEWAETHPGCRIGLVAKDAGSVRRVMLRGLSGLLSVSPPWFRPRWYKTDKLLVWPNESIAELHSSEEPQTLRGPQYHYAWVTELFHWSIPRKEREPIAWRDGIARCLRLGEGAQGVIDSSPAETDFCADFLLGVPDEAGRRPVSPAMMDAGQWSLEHELVDDTGEKRRYRVVIHRWRSEENAANMTPGIVAEWRHELRNHPRLAALELDGEILVKVEGALFSREQIDAHAVAGVPTIVLTLVAVDPTRSDSPTDEAGIIIGGLGSDGHAYVWDDYSLTASPLRWAGRALEARSLYGARGIVRETNRLPDSLKATVATLDPEVHWIDVTATTGKRTRAEPVSALYERGMVHHVRDPRDPHRLAKLESEMCSWAPGKASPNRMDALVWLVSALLVHERHAELVVG